MTFSPVTGQTAQNQVTATTITATLPNNPAIGNLVVALLTGAANGRTMTVADGAGTPNNYSPTPNTPFDTSNPGYSLGIFYFIANGTANKVITATFSSITVINIFIAEFSGNALSSVLESDATNNTTTAGTAINLPSITTINNGDLLVSVAGMNTGITSANSPWTGWPGGLPADADYAAYYIQSSAGAQAVDFTASPATAWNAMEAAFKPFVATSLLSPNQQRIMM